MAKYEEQLARARRYYDRLKRLNDGKAEVLPAEMHLDDIYAFFQNCYHLKDWLKNDPEYTSHTDKEIEDYVTAMPELSICADICNGAKHLELHHPFRSRHRPDFSETIESVGEQCTDGRLTSRTLAMYVIIEHGGAKLDAFQLATTALRLWESFIALPTG